MNRLGAGLWASFLRRDTPGDAGTTRVHGLHGSASPEKCPDENEKKWLTM